MKEGFVYLMGSAILLAVCYGLFRGSEAVHDWSDPPNAERLEILHNSLNIQENLIFTSLVNHGHEFDDVSELSIHSRELKRQADSLWSSIPEGAIIARGRPSSLRPVGRNERVVELRAEADDIDQEARDLSRQHAAEFGSALIGTPVESLWLNYESLRFERDSLLSSENRFNSTVRGKILRVTNTVSLIFSYLFGLVSFVLTLSTVLLTFAVVFSLVERLSKI